MSQDALRRRIEILMQEVRAHRDARRATIEKEMTALGQEEARLDAFAEKWLDEVVAPKLRMLADMFANSTASTRSPFSHHASLAFTRNDDFPAEVHVDVGIVADGPKSRGRLTFGVAIVPILMDYDKGSSLEFDCEAPDRVALESFLDEAIVQFVQDYLRLAEPDSPYQRNRQVKDPVCGMTLARAEASDSVEYGRRTYWFCTPKCRERFDATPQRYARG